MSYVSSTVDRLQRAPQQRRDRRALYTYTKKSGTQQTDKNTKR